MINEPPLNYKWIDNPLLWKQMAWAFLRYIYFILKTQHNILQVFNTLTQFLQSCLQEIYIITWMQSVFCYIFWNDFKNGVFSFNLSLAIIPYPNTLKKNTYFLLDIKNETHEYLIAEINRKQLALLFIGQLYKNLFCFLNAIWILKF